MSLPAIQLSHTHQSQHPHLHWIFGMKGTLKSLTTILLRLNAKSIMALVLLLKTLWLRAMDPVILNLTTIIIRHLAKAFVNYSYTYVDYKPRPLHPFNSVRFSAVVYICTILLIGIQMFHNTWAVVCLLVTHVNWENLYGFIAKNETKISSGFHFIPYIWMILHGSFLTWLARRSSVRSTSGRQQPGADEMRNENKFVSFANLIGRNAGSTIKTGMTLLDLKSNVSEKLISFITEISFGCKKFNK